MKPILRLILICSLLLLIIGCVGQKAEPSLVTKNEPQEGTAQVDIVDSPVTENEPQIGTETGIANSPREPFSPNDTEVLGVWLRASQKEVETILGKPESVDVEKSDEFGNLYFFRYNFGKVNLAPDMASKHVVYAIHISNPGFCGPREIRVGDSVEWVLHKFPDEGLKMEGTIRWLYGRDQLSHGYLYYDSDQKIYTVYYEWSNDESTCFLTIAVENDTVKSLCVAYQLKWTGLGYGTF